MSRKAILAALAITWTAPAFCQDYATDEVVVTAMRREADDYSADVPAVGVRRTADFAIVEVNITGDTRDPEQRASEIYGMLSSAIAVAPTSGVQLAFGERTLQPLTKANLRDLPLQRDSRPDSQHVSFYVKVPLIAGADAGKAEQRITGFVKTVHPVGRALMEANGDVSLSVVAPDQYRSAVIEAVAADARDVAARVGPDYRVEVEGLNKPVEWSRSGLSDVFLYVPYKLVVVPKP